MKLFLVLLFVNASFAQDVYTYTDGGATVYTNRKTPNSQKMTESEVKHLVNSGNPNSIYHETKQLPYSCYHPEEYLSYEQNQLIPQCLGAADFFAKRKMKSEEQLFKALGYSVCLRYIRLSKHHPDEFYRQTIVNYHAINECRNIYGNYRTGWLLAKSGK